MEQLLPWLTIPGTVVEMAILTLISSLDERSQSCCSSGKSIAVDAPDRRAGLPLLAPMEAEDRNPCPETP